MGSILQRQCPSSAYLINSGSRKQVSYKLWNENAVEGPKSSYKSKVFLIIVQSI